jgi:hypothetical protein
MEQEQSQGHGSLVVMRDAGHEFHLTIISSFLTSLPPQGAACIFIQLAS